MVARQEGLLVGLTRAERCVGRQQVRLRRFSGARRWRTERISSEALARVGLKPAMAPTRASRIRFAAPGRVGLGGRPPRPPTDPYVLALEHTVPLMMDSPHSQRCEPELLSWVVMVIRGSKYEASDVFPGPGPNIRHPLSVFPSLDRVPRDQFPGFIGTMRVLRLPAAHPAALSGSPSPALPFGVKILRR